MAAGDIWVRTGFAYTHISASGALIARADVPSFPYADFQQPPTIVHDGESLWVLSSNVPSGAAGKLDRLDPATFAVLGTYDPNAQSTEGNSYVGGLAVRGNGNLIASEDGVRWEMELDHAGTRVAEIGDATYTDNGPFARRVSIAPGSSTVVYEYADHFTTQVYIDVALWDLTTNALSVIQVLKPGGTASNPGSWNLAGKPDGGFWITWSNNAGGTGAALITEHAADGTTLQTCNFPDTNPFYDEITGIDVKANGDLVGLFHVYDSGHSPTDYMQLATIPAGGSGSHTLFGSQFPLSDFDGSSSGNLFFVHVERAFGPSTPPWLRQMQRDDLTRQYARNGPTSAQASIRQGPRGTYL